MNSGIYPQDNFRWEGKLIIYTGAKVSLNKKIPTKLATSLQQKRRSTVKVLYKTSWVLHKLRRFLEPQPVRSKRT